MRCDAKSSTFEHLIWFIYCKAQDNELINSVILTLINVGLLEFLQVQSDLGFQRLKRSRTALRGSDWCCI